jgi:hypothetical protein
VFENGLDCRKWTGIVVNLIDVRKKVNMFCIEKLILINLIELLTIIPIKPTYS